MFKINEKITLKIILLNKLDKKPLESLFGFV